MEDVKSINDVNSKLEENYKKYSEYLKSEEGRLYIINDILIKELILFFNIFSLFIRNFLMFKFIFLFF